MSANDGSEVFPVAVFLTEPFNIRRAANIAWYGAGCTIHHMICSCILFFGPE